MDNGDGVSGTSLTGFVTMSEFSKYCEQNDRDHTRITNAMWGNEGTNGMIKDIHDLKMWVKFTGIIVGVVVPIASALLSAWLIRLLGGG